MPSKAVFCRVCHRSRVSKAGNMCRRCAGTRWGKASRAAGQKAHASSTKADREQHQATRSWWMVPREQWAEAIADQQRRQKAGSDGCAVSQVDGVIGGW
jgi:molybdenum cofactor biosynthesis enzyme MoaA